MNQEIIGIGHAIIDVFCKVELRRWKKLLQNPRRK